MDNQSNSLRFDHREIAVIFSLFIFVSLLMFTVGILVGKGLAQARYEALILKTAGAGAPPAAAAGAHAEAHGHAAAQIASPVTLPPTGSSVSTSPPPAQIVAEPAHPEERVITAEEPTPEHAPVKPIPKEKSDAGMLGNHLKDAETAEAEALLSNPNVKRLIDQTPDTKAPPFSPVVAGKAGTAAPGPAGNYTVQVGSYPDRQDAEARLESLKKQGFPQAYLSAKELGDQKEVWYRVWLGYFPDLQSAIKNGEILQQRGEVKNYLVRKVDSAGEKN